MGLSQIIQALRSTSTRPLRISLALLVQELPVEEEGCTSTKHIFIYLLPIQQWLSICGSTARMGDGPGPELMVVVVTPRAPTGFPVLAHTTTPVQSLRDPRCIQYPCGVRARSRSLAFKTATRHPRPPRRPRRPRPPRPPRGRRRSARPTGTRAQEVRLLASTQIAGLQ